MMLSLFDQFQTPYMLGVPLMALALLAPTALVHPSMRPAPGRLEALQAHSVAMITKQLMLPLSTLGHTWSLPLMVIMAFLLLINLLGLLPYTFTPTTQLALNMGLALPLWLATVVTGLRTNPTASAAHLLPLGTPTPLIPALVMIETVSLLIRPLALGVRLTANLTAGHLLMTLISLTSLTLATTLPSVAITTTILLVLLTLLEIAVAVIQAYVFTLLLSLYLQENT